MSDNDQCYYRNRALNARKMADAARDPAIKDIHTQMADRYVVLAEGPSPSRRRQAANA